MKTYNFKSYDFSNFLSDIIIINENDQITSTSAIITL